MKKDDTEEDNQILDEDLFLVVLDKRHFSIVEDDETQKREIHFSELIKEILRPIYENEGEDCVIDIWYTDEQMEIAIPKKYQNHVTELVKSMELSMDTSKAN
jgi:hypothetical protein